MNLKRFRINRIRTIRESAVQLEFKWYTYQQDELLRQECARTVQLFSHVYNRIHHDFLAVFTRKHHINPAENFSTSYVFRLASSSAPVFSSHLLRDQEKMRICQLLPTMTSHLPLKPLPSVAGITITEHLTDIQRGRNLLRTHCTISSS